MKRHFECARPMRPDDMPLWLKAEHIAQLLKRMQYGPVPLFELEIMLRYCGEVSEALQEAKDDAQRREG